MHACTYAACSMLHSEPALPDPIKLLRRIHALENATSSLQKECHELATRRQRAVIDATQGLAFLEELCGDEVSSLRVRFV